MSNHQSPRNSRDDFLSDIAFGAGIVLLLLVATSLITGPGCATTSRTNVSPATTNATHETRTERAGRTVISEYELEITPPSDSDSGDDSTLLPQSSGAGNLQGSMVAPMVPAVLGLAEPEVFSMARRGVGGVSHITPLTPVGYAPERDDDAIAEAIREAVRNGSSVKLKQRETEEIPLTADTSNSSLDDSGPGLNTSSDEAAIGFDGRKSGASLPWGGESGKTKWGLDASLISRGVNPLMIIGAIVMIAAVIPVVSPPRRWFAAGIVAGTGLLIIAAGVVSEQAPWVFVLAILAFLGVAGWLGYEAWRNKRRQVALGAIVEGIEKSAIPGLSVKDNIAHAAGGKIAVVKSEVNATKAKERIAKTT